MCVCGARKGLVASLFSCRGLIDSGGACLGSGRAEQYPVARYGLEPWLRVR